MRRKTLPLDEALRLTREIASALEHAHRRGKMLAERLETSFEIQGVGMSLAGLAAAASALRLISAGKGEWRRIGVHLQIKFWNELLDRYLGTARSVIDPRAADIARSEGADITFDDAIAMALAAE